MPSLSKKQRICTAILLFSSFVLSCSSSRMGSTVEKETVVKVPLYRPAAEVPEYRLGIGDELEITVGDTKEVLPITGDIIRIEGVKARAAWKDLLDGIALLGIILIPLILISRGLYLLTKK